MSRRRLSVVALVAFIATLAIACSGAASAPAPYLDSVGNRVGTVPVAAPTGAPYEAPASDQNTSNAAQAPDQQLIVYTGSLQLEVADVTAAVAQANQAVSAVGGRVAGSSSSDTENGQFATVTYRIPAARWSEALAALKAVAAKVIDENIGAEDVTAEVVDLDARLANLRVTETALQTIMDRATTITDVLKVQSELTKVRGDIERLTAQRDNRVDQAALGTLEVGFNLPAVARVQEASQEWDLGREVDNALAALVRLGQGVASLLVLLTIVVAPVVVPVLLIIWAAVWLRRRWLRNHPPAPLYGAPPLE